MLDEMPVLTPLQRPKRLVAEPTITQTIPSLFSKVSFLPFIEYLKKKQNFDSEARERLYTYLVKKFEHESSLLHDINNLDTISEHTALMELLVTSLFPVVDNQESHNFALGEPYQFSVFYYSENFRKLFFDKEEAHLLLPESLPVEQLKAIQCAMIYDHILEQFYGMKLNENPELIYPVTDIRTGMLRYFRIRYDRRFIKLILKGTLPPIQDCGVCMNTFRILDLDKQLAKMPLDLFEAEGFAVWVAEDITASESLESIKRILLREGDCDTHAIESMKNAVKALVGLSDIEVGLMPFVKVNDQFVLDEDSAKHSLVARQWLNKDPESMAQFRMYMGFLKEYPVAMPVSLLNDAMFGFAPFLISVYNEGARSYITYPMQNGDGLIGLLELTSPTPGLLTHETIARLETAIPLISLAMLKCRDSFGNRIEKLIKEKFTALQQSVEWKFTEVAWDHLRSTIAHPVTTNVTFDNVYPLYGAIDVRNSTIERNHAIQRDLKAHLLLIAETLEKLQSIMQLPLLEGLEFKNDNLRESIDEVMTAEDEVGINEFLSADVDPVFQHLQKNMKETEAVIAEYFRTVDDTDGPLYKNRRDYEETLARINNEVLQYLEKEEELTQKSYPHYFEQYRTDGIEYNIYIGQSISPGNPFDLLYLRNLRLWQLRSMAEAAMITHRLLPELKLPLQTTQLILIHSQCIAISFRKDERRFDVEGSYNIRYEVIKKRLDKVRVKDTGERLTQPARIAIVYSNQKEAQEYEEYIRFLQKKMILKEGTEMLELEELQGVKGLKALRVEINLDARS
jgi:hypothetical protein